MMVPPEWMGRVDARLERIESTRQRLLDALPVAATLAAIIGIFIYMAGRFEHVDAGQCGRRRSRCPERGPPPRACSRGWRRPSQSTGHAARAGVAEALEC